MTAALEAINFEATDGRFAVKRVLGTYTLRTGTNGRIIVSDDRKGVDVGWHADVAAAVKAWKREDDYRLCNK